MRQAATLIALGLMLSSCSSGIDSYEEGMDAQAELMSEMISVLKEVDDESSANKAAEKIEEIGRRMAGIADQMKELPRPNAEEMQEIADKQRAKLRAIQQDVTEQMMKMAQYPVLQDAWMNAMHDIH